MFLASPRSSFCAWWGRFQKPQPSHVPLNQINLTFFNKVQNCLQIAHIIIANYHVRLLFILTLYFYHIFFKLWLTTIAILCIANIEIEKYFIEKWEYDKNQKNCVTSIVKVSSGLWWWNESFKLGKQAI